MMVNLMRSNQRWLMIVVSVLVLISFLYYFGNNTRVERLGGDRAGTIYGRNVTITEIQRAERQLRTAVDLGLSHVAAPELVQQKSLNDALVDQYVMQHQAEAYGILPTDDAANEAAQNLPVFKGPNGSFDESVKDAFVANSLNPRGFTEGQVIDLVRRDLQFAKLRQIIDSTVVVTPAEVRTRYELENSRVETSVIHFKNADFLAGIDPSEDDIKKTFDAQRDQYEKPERRKVQYVRFGLDDAQKKLAGPERRDALQTLSNQAVAFLEKLNDAKGKQEFADVAKAANLPVKETVEFEQQDTAGLAEASINGFAASAYKLSAQNPDSDVPLRSPLQATDSFYVLHLSGMTPSRPLTLDEARPKIVAALKDERAKAALSARAEEVRAKIAESMKAGKSFADAAKDAGQTVQDLPGFALSEPPPDNFEVVRASTELATGELSKFLPSADGGELVFLRGRSGIDEAAFDKTKGALMSMLRRRKVQAVFEEWLRSSRQAADAKMTVQLRS